MGNFEKFKERKIEYYTFLFASIIYPTLLPFGIIYTLWKWKFNVFDSAPKIATIGVFIFLFFILFPLLIIFINGVKDFKPGKKFLKLKDIEFEKLKTIVVKAIEDCRIYNIKLNSEPKDNLSDILFRKDIFIVELEDNSIIRIKKNRYFKEETATSKKVWDLQYDGRQVENGSDIRLLENLYQMLESHVID